MYLACVMMPGYFTAWVTAMYLSMLMATRLRMEEVQVHMSTVSQMKHMCLPNTQISSTSYTADMGRTSMPSSRWVLVLQLQATWDPNRVVHQGTRL